MTIPLPFSSGFPLTATPFKSRVENNIYNNKNYYAVAFKPGFPLQASELNEMQEIFYVQQTVNNEFLKTNDWTIKTTPWDGATPMLKSMVVFSTTDSTITIKSGWYHIKSSLFNGGVGVWIYNDTDLSTTITHTETSQSASSYEYGLYVKSKVIECSPNATPGTNQDVYLQDHSNFNVIGGPCGAARLKLEIIGGGRKDEASSDVFTASIFKGPSTSGTGTRTITFMNNESKQNI
jgi:hypothetical protein